MSDSALQVLLLLALSQGQEVPGLPSFDHRVPIVVSVETEAEAEVLKNSLALSTLSEAPVHFVINVKSSPASPVIEDLIAQAGLAALAGKERATTRWRPTARPSRGKPQDSEEQALLREILREIKKLPPRERQQALVELWEILTEP